MSPLDQGRRKSSAAAEPDLIDGRRRRRQAQRNHVCLSISPPRSQPLCVNGEEIRGLPPNLSWGTAGAAGARPRETMLAFRFLRPAEPELGDGRRRRRQAERNHACLSISPPRSQPLCVNGGELRGLPLNLSWGTAGAAGARPSETPMTRDTPGVLGLGSWVLGLGSTRRWRESARRPPHRRHLRRLRLPLPAPPDRPTRGIPRAGRARRA